MAKTGKFTAQQVIDVIPGTGGIISTIASALGCTWITAKKYIENKPSVKQAYEDELEATIDLAEGVILRSIKRNDSADAKWFLSRKGKDRGWVERTEITGKDGEAVSIKVARGIQDRD